MMNYIKIFLKKFNLSKIEFLFLLTGLILAIISMFYQLDFGAFKRDYFEAHSLGMDHLHESSKILDLMLTIPNSASGVLPLYIFGIFKTLLARRILSFLSYLTIILLIIFKGKINDKLKLYSVLFFIISPIMISSFLYCLPETLGILILILFLFLKNKNKILSSFLAFCLPLGRQTYVVNLFNQLFIDNKYKNIILYGFMGFLGLFLLYIIWGGLVPPRLVKVHMTPSLKASINALYIFCLYFLYYSLTSFLRNPRINFIKLIVAIVITLTNLFQNKLYGGGYVFSRIENYNIIIAFLIETTILYLFIYTINKRLLAIIIVFCLSFITTNYMFLKYVDFYAFSLLAYKFFTNTSIIENKIFKSFTFFQIISLMLSISFYYVIK